MEQPKRKQMLKRLGARRCREREREHGVGVHWGERERERSAGLVFHLGCGLESLRGVGQTPRLTSGKCRLWMCDRCILREHGVWTRGYQSSKTKEVSLPIRSTEENCTACLAGRIGSGHATLVHFHDDSSWNRNVWGVPFAEPGGYRRKWYFTG